MGEEEIVIELRDILATLVTLVGAIAWLRLWDAIAHRGWVTSKLSRKIIHITTGPLFVLCWPLFSSSQLARYGAALVPGLIVVQFVGVGMGWIEDPAAVEAMTRTGNPREILKGPLLYGLIFVVCTLLFWRTSPVGIVALMVMCGGDGFADIVGRRFGTHKLPWNHDKSWAGSGGMLLGSFGFSMTALLLFSSLGFVPFMGHEPRQWVAVLAISTVATGVESLPIRDVDNLTLTLTCVGLGLWLLG